MIKPLLMSDIASVTGGELSGRDIPVHGVSIDTRTIQAGDLFVAIKGESFDGHDYISMAIEKGCAGVVVESGDVSEVPAVLVENTRLSLAQIAGMNRQNFAGKLVGITGSSGKTTAKNLLASIFSQAGRTMATKGNFNNEIGVPLTLLTLQQDHEFAVVEMGARRVGDIDYLGSFVRPDVAILLNVGDAHIDVFGSYENIVTAKSEIFNNLAENGAVVFNADDPAAQAWVEMTSDQRTIRFSAGDNDAEVWADVIEYKQDYSRFNLCVEGESTPITLPMPGHHNILNALAASAAAIAVGLTLEQIKYGLESAANDDGRLHAIDLPNGTRVIDDSYNANPASMKAALDVVNLYEGTKIAIVGEMAELGDFSERLHIQVADYGRSTEINQFLLVGPYAEGMARVLGERARVFPDKQALIEYLGPMVKGNETILVKGSRCAAMDEIVDWLREENS
jgi:UDP-N-acetylmuramoyl-tripeptide--D-alanyl-D-alanine ligase